MGVPRGNQGVRIQQEAVERMIEERVVEERMRQQAIERIVKERVHQEVLQQLHGRRQRNTRELPIAETGGPMDVPAAGHHQEPEDSNRDKSFVRKPVFWYYPLLGEQSHNPK